jgi:hypothetical protein
MSRQSYPNWSDHTTLKTCELFCSTSDCFEFLTSQYSPQHPVKAFLFMAEQPPVGQDLLIIEDSWSYSDTPHSVALLWTSDQPEAETSTWQHTTLTTDRHQCPWRDSNLQYQQAIGRRPTPKTARPSGTTLCVCAAQFLISAGKPKMMASGRYLLLGRTVASSFAEKHPSQFELNQI